MVEGVCFKDGFGSGSPRASIGISFLHLCPVLSEITPEPRGKAVESDQVGKGHGEDHGVREFENRSQRRGAADDSAHAVEDVEGPTHGGAGTHEIDDAFESVTGPRDQGRIGEEDSLGITKMPLRNQQV